MSVTIIDFSLPLSGRGSTVGTLTGLGAGRCGVHFPLLQGRFSISVSRQTLGSTQPPV